MCLHNLIVREDPQPQLDDDIRSELSLSVSRRAESAYSTLSYQDKLNTVTSVLKSTNATLRRDIIDHLWEWAAVSTNQT